MLGSLAASKKVYDKYIPAKDPKATLENSRRKLAAERFLSRVKKHSKSVQGAEFIEVPEELMSRKKITPQVITKLATMCL